MTNTRIAWCPRRFLDEIRADDLSRQPEYGACGATFESEGSERYVPFQIANAGVRTTMFAT